MRGVFLCFGGQKKFLRFLKKYFSNSIEKLHKMAFIYVYIYFFFSFEKVEKIGCHSNFNFECDTESGSKESLSIALGMLAILLRSI